MCKKNVEYNGNINDIVQITRDKCHERASEIWFAGKISEQDAEILIGKNPELYSFLLLNAL